MQMAIIEFFRNVVGIKQATSSEIDENAQHFVIDLMENQKNTVNYGGTMRLGAWECRIKPNTIAEKIYGKKVISERHRHRYEFNSKYKQQMEEAGMYAVGVNPKTDLVEIVENRNHPWFVGVQFHPEYKSTVESPHPLFVAFVEASLKCKSSSK